MLRIPNIDAKIVGTTLLMGAVLFASACAQDRQFSGSKKASDDGAPKDIPCNEGEGNCPKILMGIAANPMNDGKIVGSVIGMEPWTIMGTTQGGGSRDIRMKAHNPPVGGEFLGQGSLNIQAKYNTNEPKDSKVPINVVIRDVSRCKHDRPNDAAACENLDQTGLEDFEVKGSMDWSIIMGDVNMISDPSFTQNQPVPQGANAGATGCVAGLVPGVIGGLVTGSLIGGILKGTMGCITTSMGQLGQ